MHNLKQKLIKHMLREGIDLRTDTKARGNLGLFSENRIDIHRKLPDDKFVEVLLHEYAHLVHRRLEPDMAKTGGHLEVLFKLDDENLIEKIKKELISVTCIVDENALFTRLDAQKYAYKIKIKAFENLIKKDYPDFLKSKPFKEFERYIKKSDARFLLKYDRIRIVTPFLRREKIYSIDALDKDFPSMPQAFKYYIKIYSLSRKSRNIQKRKTKLKKYYEKPSELFARFVQGLVRQEGVLQTTAPITYSRFFELLSNGHFQGLDKVIDFFREYSL